MKHSEKREKGASRGGNRGKFKTGKEFEAVVFVPATANGTLGRNLQKRDDKFAAMQGLRRVKFVERGGDTLRCILTSSDPFKKRECGREGCWPCKGPIVEPGTSGNDNEASHTIGQTDIRCSDDPK